MGKLTYGMMMSLDGFVTDPSDHLDEESLGFINNEMRKYGTEIYGRRMYEAMVYWETYQQQSGAEYANDFARIWKGLDKLVISSSLEQASSDKTRIMRDFRAEEIRQLKTESTKDISVAGPTLAAQFIKASLIDEYALYTIPVIVGAGNPVFKDIEGQLDLEFVEERRFPTGMAFQRYVPRNKSA
ncbi:dihydrofolate reductase family protein [Chelativorans sp. M5D2P16]|uniref:dihydrofolate reductase family protein n=1 Tax=Chelativorans sp. M5D2P16 TaxID=3095678 RepID=UPI002ACA2DBA|nr:dihydrofolate reductase family protein [Chelativorans sp. M5D2P16]MDZ5698721.1 dihydrofolate reductase family protein [Chelativorans sp. M5D2P16]